MEQIDQDWEVSVDELKRMHDAGEPYQLIDVREPSEYELCRIDDAKLIPLDELPNRVEEVRGLADDRLIVLHCHHGGRSLRAAELLRRAGIDGCKSMAGGIDAWSERIDPGVPRY